MSELYLVATPIGNSLDFSTRAIETLKKSDLIYCEDTRTSKVLMSLYDIETPLKSFHIHNEKERVKEIIEQLNNQKVISIISDAGYPSISDPGYSITKAVIENGFKISVIPGASACLVALVGSGLPTEKFFFFGFLHHTKTAKEKELLSLIDFEYTTIYYDSPLRIKDTLEIMNRLYPDRFICIARELTKKYQEYIRGSVNEVYQKCDNLKGEIVIVLEGSKKKKIVMDLNNCDVLTHYKHYKDLNYSDMEAMKLVSKDRDISKSEIYKIIKGD